MDYACAKSTGPGESPLFDLIKEPLLANQKGSMTILLYKIHLSITPDGLFTCS